MQTSMLQTVPLIPLKVLLGNPVYSSAKVTLHCVALSDLTASSVKLAERHATRYRRHNKLESSAEEARDCTYIAEAVA